VADSGTSGEQLASETLAGEALARNSQERSQVARTGRGKGGTETIAAELAGWASGELPGQASARLAAWEAIGGVPAADSRQPGSPGNVLGSGALSGGSPGDGALDGGSPDTAPRDVAAADLSVEPVR
jgi:hypothetical protein